MEQEERQEITDAVADGMSSPQGRRNGVNYSVLQWIIGILVSIILLGAGTLLGRETVAGDIKENNKAHVEFSSKIGLHDEQIRQIYKTLDEIKENQAKTNDKIDKVLDRLPARTRG